jgi:hypothetical protein
LGIASSTITGDYVNQGRRGKPSGHGCRPTVGQKVDDASLLQIADHRAVALATLESPVNDADYAWGYDRWQDVTSTYS